MFQAVFDSEFLIIIIISSGGHCHGHFLAFLVKWHQNYDLVLSTMQEMLLELKGKDMFKEEGDCK